MEDNEQETEDIFCYKCGVKADEYPGTFFLAGNGEYYCQTCYIITPGFKRGDAKVARNAKCPCGSGRKFKHCCLRI